MKKRPVIITCALVGAELSRKDTPYLPMQPHEIIRSGLEAGEAGASILHIHVRDEKGLPSLDPKILKQVAFGIRAHNPNLILQVSTGGSVKDSFQQRKKVLLSQFDMASLSMGTTNFANDIFLNPRPFIQDLANKMSMQNILPELEIFNLAMLEEALHFRKRNIITDKAPFGFVLGVPGALSASFENLTLLHSRLPAKALWTCTCIGKRQFPMIKEIVHMGGNLRLGMEDNIYLSKGKLAFSNAQLVQKAVRIINSEKYEVAHPKMARKILGLPS